MVSRLPRAFALAGVVVASALLTVACEKVPLLAPSGSSITLIAASTALPINGTTSIIAQVIEPSGTPPHSGTRVTFTTNLGRIEPSEADTDLSGKAVVTFIAGTGSGTATIGAISGGVSVATANVIKIQVGAAAAGSLSVSASPATLPSTGGTSTIVATVADSSGNTLASVPVTFAIDTATGSSGSGSLSATVVNTDASGRAQTTLTTNRTTTVSATAGVGAASGTPPTGGAQTSKVTVTVNTTASITIGAATPATPTAGQTVTLALTYGTAATASPITRVTVDWGDGQSQSYNGQPAAISHAYRAPGSYLIVVTGIDGLGDTATTTTSVTVAPQARPVVTITSSTANPQPNQAVSFTISATEPATSTATIQSISIDFGDGTPALLLPGGTTSVQHVYQSPGTFVVTVVATDTNGATGSGSTVIVVGATAPTAAFTISPEPSKVNTAASFNGSDSTSSATITSYTWDFGDGTFPETTSGPATSHIYLTAGSFTARLTIRDSLNRTATASKAHVVNP